MKGGRGREGGRERGREGEGKGGREGENEKRREVNMKISVVYSFSQGPQTDGISPREM